MLKAIESILRKFAVEIEAVVRKGALTKIGLGPDLRRTKSKVTAVLGEIKKKRKKGPIQLCPSPGCKNPAAPVFGMVCAKHKNAKKSDVAKWREARRKRAKGPKLKLVPKPKPKTKTKKAA